MVLSSSMIQLHGCEYPRCLFLWEYWWLTSGYMYNIYICIIYIYIMIWYDMMWYDTIWYIDPAIDSRIALSQIRQSILYGFNPFNEHLMDINNPAINTGGLMGYDGLWPHFPRPLWPPRTQSVPWGAFVSSKCGPLWPWERHGETALRWDSKLGQEPSPN